MQTDTSMSVCDSCIISRIAIIGEMASQSVQPAKTELHNRNLLLTVLEAGKSKIKAPADLVFGEGLLPGSQMSMFSLSPHMIEGSLWDLFYKSTKPIQEGSAFMI